MERNVANAGQNRYAQSEGIIIMTNADSGKDSGGGGLKPASLESHSIDKPLVERAHGKFQSKPFDFHDIAPKPENDQISPEIRRAQESNRLRLGSESAELQQEKPKIPFERVSEAVQVISDIRQGRDVVIDRTDIDKFGAIIADFSPKIEDEQANNQPDKLEPEQVILKLNEVLSGADVTIPDADSDFWSYKKDSPARITQEEFIKSQIESVKAFDQKPIDLQRVKDSLTFTEDTHTGFPKEGTLGAAAAPPPTVDSWTRDLPDEADVADPVMASYIKNIRSYEADVDLDDVAVKTLLTVLVSEVIKKRADGELDPDLSKKVIDAANIGRLQIEGMLRIAANMDSKTREKYERTQLISYGESSLPRLSNIGETDVLKTDPVDSDKIIMSLVDAATLEKLKKLSVSDFDKFKEGKWHGGSFDLYTNYVETKEVKEEKNKEIQIAIYKALKKDQIEWLHSELNKLPVEDFDPERMQSNLAYRDLLSAQPEMVGEIADYAKNLRMGYELYYRYQKNGVRAIAEGNSSITMEMYTSLMKKAHGWDAVTGEIESMITGEQGKEYRGVYMSEWNEDGTQKSMRPKTQLEIDLHEKLLKKDYVLSDKDRALAKANEIKIDYVVGDDKGKVWLVGGFRRLDVKEHEDNIREHLREVAKKDLEDGMKKFNSNRDDMEKIKKDDTKSQAEKDRALHIFKQEHSFDIAYDIEKSEIEARTKIAANLGENVFWRMSGRASYWGLRGSFGEESQFPTIGFPFYITMEAKGGSNLTGRKMRQLLVGADTLDEFNRKQVPGLSNNSANMNVGYFAAIDNNAQFFDGERLAKPLLGFDELKDENGDYILDENGRRVFERNGFLRGNDDYFRNKGLLAANETVADKVESLYLRVGLLLKEENEGDISGVIDRDKLWENARKRLSDKDRDFLEEFNNIPIASYAGKANRRAFLNMIKKAAAVTNDFPDYFGSDRDGAEIVKNAMVDNDSGFIADPAVGHINAVKEHGGKKRGWQRIKMATAMLETLIEFRCKFNKFKGLDNWGADKVDTVLTDVRNNELIDQRTKLKEEKKLYKTITPNWEKRIPVWGKLMEIPALHKLAYVHDRSVFMAALGAAWGGLSEGTKRLIAYLLSAFRV